MRKFVDIRLKQEILEKYQLPDILYPMLGSSLDSILAGDDELPFAEMLFALQQRSMDGQADWKSLEPAMDRLTQLIAPADARTVISAAGDNWFLEIGPVDLNERIVTIQRGDELIAAIVNRGDGRLRVAVYRPLDGKSAGYLISAGIVPHPTYGVCMRENKWEYVLDNSVTMGNAYASMRGEAYLSYWEKGIGILNDGSTEPDWRDKEGLTPRPAIFTAVELGINYSFSQGDNAQPHENDDVLQKTPATEPSGFSWISKRQQQRTVRGRFLGCLLGGAVGDALGAPVEFMRRAEILERFGSHGITDYAPAYGGIGTITDDTQMALFTAEGLIRAQVRFCFKGITAASGVVANAYKRWLLTQGELPAKELPSDADGWLFQQKALHARRAPGNTCLSALKKMRSFGEAAQNDSKGCGGVMRIAPVGLAGLRLGWNARDTFETGVEIAELTHGHPTSSLSSGVLAVLIQALADGAPLAEGLRVAKNILRTADNHDESLRAIERAEELAASSHAPHESIAMLGEGWIAEEALAISIYCALKARSFKRGVVLAVNHSGDSDSTGAITGNLLGTMYGVKSIPDTWLDRLELRTVITELAEDLFDFTDWELGPFTIETAFEEKIWQKYPGY